MGDFKSFSADKTYYGIDGGLQLTYQISALLGVTLSGDYGVNKYADYPIVLKGYGDHRGSNLANKHVCHTLVW